jgi:sugar/nucleoside kinase (ribokinase family)
MKKIGVLGDSNVDMLIYLNNSDKLSDPKLFCGGTSANVAFGLAKLDNDVEFYGALGNDIHGKFIMEDMIKSHINIENLEKLESINTAMVIGIVDKEGERNLFVWPPNNAAHTKYSIKNHQLEDIKNLDWLHVSGISLREQPVCTSMLKAMKKCFQNNITISFDLNLRIELWGLNADFKKTIFEAISYSDFVLGSLNEEFEEIFDSKNLKSEISKIARKDQVFITRDGANGSYAYKNKVEYSTPAIDILPVDTVGAGDAFNTGFIHSMINDNNLVTSLQKANAVAAYKLLGESARHLPNRKQLNTFLSI